MRRILIIMVLTIVGISYSYNCADRHGNNYFTYDGQRVFPIIWDIRAARCLLSDYSYHYGGSISEGFDKLHSILLQAKWAGINAVLVRSELSQDNNLDPGSYADHAFTQTAYVARDLDLNLFAGGFRTNPEEDVHNDAVVDFLGNYQSLYTDLWWGDFVGVTAFDEPDAHWRNDGQNSAWTSMVENYSDDVHNDLGLPFSSFLDRYEYLDITTFCPLHDFPIYDRYPCNCYDYSNYIIQSELDRFCATDLEVQLRNNGSYETYSTQDELIRVYDTSVWLYRFINEHQPNGLQTEAIGSFPVPAGSTPVRYASSDFRATDVGDRATGLHDGSGAVVVWREETNNNTVIYNHNGPIISTQLPLPSTSISITDCCVGETNYSVVYPTRQDREGLVGHGQMRILVCYNTNDVQRVRILSKDYEASSGLINVTIVGGSQHSLGLPAGFEPDGVVWGTFWHKTEQSGWIIDPYSGFVLYKTSGEYVVVHQINAGSSEEWVCTDLMYDLFPVDINQDLLFISRSDEGMPVYSAGKDYLCLMHEPNPYYDVLYWNTGNIPSEGLPAYSSINVSGITGEIISAGADRAGKEWSHKLDRLVIGSTEGIYSSRRDYPLSFDGGNILCERLKYYSANYMTSARVYDSRRPHRSAVCLRGYPWFNVLMLDAQLDPGFYMDSYADEKNSVWNWGISGTDKSFFPNVQAYGRHGQENGTYCPSVDELRYMVVAPIVLGARGIQFYALDLALKSGNGAEQSDSHEGFTGYQCPSELINWGPSSDTGNPNMLSRINQVTNELVNEAPFTSALISSNCSAMESDIKEAIYVNNRITVMTDTDTGFLALRSSESGNIYVMLVNNSSNYTGGFRCFWFPEEENGGWILHNIGGYEVHKIGESIISVSEEMEITAPRNLSNTIDTEITDEAKAVIDLMVFYDGMPPYTASLFYLEPKDIIQPLDSRAGLQMDDVLLETRGMNGSMRIDLSIGRGYQEASLEIYDISGRKTCILWEDNSGEGIVNSFTLDNASYPIGVYFTVLKIDGNFMSRKFTILR